MMDYSVVVAYAAGVVVDDSIFVDDVVDVASFAVATAIENILLAQ